MSVNNTATSTPTLRVLMMREGRPATVETVGATPDAFAKAVQGEPVIMPITDQFSLVLPHGTRARPNLRIIDAGGPGFGMICGSCFVVRQHEDGLASLSDGDVAVLRGFMEARRVGVC